jgi:hypothetical protein
MESSNRRNFFRIAYPEHERPRLVLGSTICEVVDCSEGGLLFRPSPLEDYRVGQEIHGRLRLSGGRETPIAGEIIRVSDEAVSVKLEVGIPFGLILKEQLHLRRADD